MNILKAFVKRTGYSIGRMARETGLALDAAGSRYTKDIAHLELLSRHRNIMPLYDLQPIILNDTYIAPNASVIGEVFLGAQTTVWYGATLRGDINAIRIGSNCSIGDQTVINTTPSLPFGVPASVNIGNNVNIENNCSLYSCTVDDGVQVGFKSIILEGSRLERGCVIGPNSVVPPGRLIPAGTYWAGNPVEYVRDLTEQEIQENISALDNNVKLGSDHQYGYLPEEEAQRAQ